MYRYVDVELAILAVSAFPPVFIDRQNKALYPYRESCAYCCRTSRIDLSIVSKCVVNTQRRRHWSYSNVGGVHTSDLVQLDLGMYVSIPVMKRFNCRVYRYDSCRGSRGGRSRLLLHVLCFSLQTENARTGDSRLTRRISLSSSSGYS